MVDSSDSQNVVLGDFYYDLEITVIQSKSGALSELNVYESISDNFNKIVCARHSDGRSLHNMDVYFSVIPPSEDDETNQYTMIVVLDSKRSSRLLSI